MQRFQNTQDGSIWEFEDGVVPANYPNVPKTLTQTIKEKPSNSHVWAGGDWFFDADLDAANSNLEIMAKIRMLEEKQQRPLRELALGDSSAMARVQDIEAQIITLRVGLR